MAACPYCVIVDRSIIRGETAGCTAGSNPGNANNGSKVTSVGVSYAKCFEGREVA